MTEESYRAFTYRWLRERLTDAHAAGYTGKQAKAMIGMGIAIHGFPTLIPPPVKHSRPSSHS